MSRVLCKRLLPRCALKRHCSTTERTVRKPFVPAHLPPCENDVHKLRSALQSTRKILVLTGAGVSTESGIPDYRSEKVGRYATSSERPVQHQEMVRSAKARQKYWARSYVGWPRMSNIQPNFAHLRLAQWEMEGRLSWLITQNVDGLHVTAGSTRITELHGCLRHVICLNCDKTFSRGHIQSLMEIANVGFIDPSNVTVAPDGDVDLKPEHIHSFSSPLCPNCSEDSLKPDVVFFGDNVRRNIVDLCRRKVEESDCLLVLGSSLHVYSGYRFVKYAEEQRKPIFGVNIGETRADKCMLLKLSYSCNDVLRLLDL